MGRNNFQLNGVLVRRDLYRLGCLIASDAMLFEMAEGESDEMLALRDEFMTDEIVHLLVSIATANRIHLDHLKDARSSHLSPAGDVCGLLQPSVLEDAEIPLTFREACNKIIHAVNIVPETAGDPAEHPIGDLFILRGYRDQKAWQAFLNIGSYIRCSAANFREGS